MSPPTCNPCTNANSRRAGSWLGLLWGLSVAAPALGQVSPAGLYPPPPVPPAVITRDGGGVTVRAERVATPLRIDGQLNESAYQDVLAISEFIQNDPAEGEPASEETEVWLLFDDDYVYVVARCWESQPDRLVANEMRRDNTRIVRDDNFAWSFDTFYDRRNGYLFEVSAVGGRIDGQFTNESQLNIDWNPVYDVAVGRFDGGWTMEAALPYKSLRYRDGGPQVWGFQARRVNRWRNESSYLTPLSAAQGLRGHFRASLMATRSWGSMRRRRPVSWRSSHMLSATPRPRSTPRRHSPTTSGATRVWTSRSG